MILNDLKGKNAVITGAAGGIGKATAEIFAQQGTNLALCDINENELRKTAKYLEKYDVKIMASKVDVCDNSDIEEFIRICEDELKQIDILLNCAGISLEYKMNELPENVWNKIMDINLKSVFLFNKAVANHMIKNNIAGNITSVSSQASKMGEYGFGAYGASKAAINTMTQALSLELAEYGINVNAVCPGFVDTEMMRREFREQSVREGVTEDEIMERLCGTIPMKRMADPSEIGDFLAFLSSSSSGYITGVSLTIAGGAMII